WECPRRAAPPAAHGTRRRPAAPRPARQLGRRSFWRSCGSRAAAALWHSSNWAGKAWEQIASGGIAGRMADAIHTATRIAAGDDKTDYDNIAITLHWLTALLVIVQFALAETWDWFGRHTRETMQDLHTSLGVLLTAVVLTRVVWRLIPGHQRPTIVSGWVEIASKSVHYLLYALLIAQALLGFTVGWSAGHPIHVFGLP